MELIIIGAGLGGLSAAFRFAALGHRVQVYEQRSLLSPRGGSLSTRPAASKILHAWGMAGDLERIANKAHAIVMRNLMTGDIVGKSSAAAEDTKYPHWGTTREELIQLFYSKAIEAGASVSFGHTVSDVREDAHRAFATLNDGTTVSGDLILATDGIHSPTRHSILAGLGSPLDPIVSPITAYGFKLDALQVKEYPDAAQLVENQSSNVWMGDRVFAVSRYSPKGQYVAVLCHSTRATDQKALWDEKGDIGYIREALAGSCAGISRALQMADSCDRWKFAELPPLPRWTSEKGRIVLLGDSAHAMHPSAGQGFSQIVEDIEVLAQLVSQATEPARDVARLTETWQDIRKSRAERIQDLSRWNTRKVSKEMQHQEQRPGDVDFEDPKFVKWTLEYDVKEEVSIEPPNAAYFKLRTDNLKIQKYLEGAK